MGNQRDKVNELIKKSFGIFYNGDWVPGKWLVNGGSADYRGKELNCIGRPKFLSFGFYAKGVGRFLKKDGSELEVNPTFLKQAEKYTRLYQKEFDIHPKVFV